MIASRQAPWPLLLTAVLLLLLLAIAACDQEVVTYSTRLAGMDPDLILNNDELVKKYFRCLMERGPCTSGGEDIKRLLPEAIATDCSHCNDAQKLAVYKVMRFLVEKRPDLWVQLERKYGVYRRS